MYNFAGFSERESLRFSVVFAGKMQYDKNREWGEKTATTRSIFVPSVVKEVRRNP